MASGSDGESTAAATSEEEHGESEREDDRAESGSEEQGTQSDGEEQGEESKSSVNKASIASAVEDVSSLPGETVNDQDGRKIGEVREIYGVGDDETPMWVTIESSTGLGRTRHVFVPLARIKNQNDELRVPYSFSHVHDAPDVEPGDELSEEDDHALRVYYAIGLADQELIENAQSYASQVPDEDDPARKIEASAAEGPVREIDDTPPAERAAEAYEKQREEQDEEEHHHGRKATADEIFEEDGNEKGGDGQEPKGEEKSSDDDGEKDEHDSDGDEKDDRD